MTQNNSPDDFKENLHNNSDTKKEDAKDTDQSSSEFISSILHHLARLSYIRPSEIPNINLYMDQVTTFMDTHLKESKRFSEDKILTKTMINNYAKNNLLPPPVKKKYSKDHMLMLIFIYYFKNLLSINDVRSLLGPLADDFFDGKNPALSLDHIYKEIYRLEKAQVPHVTEDIIEKYKLSEHFFESSNEEEEKFLQLFTFVCLLSFDVYVKKQMIENIIDDVLRPEAQSGKTESSTKKEKK